jgi:tetratricopeptide (TPR) repeat protein
MKKLQMVVLAVAVLGLTGGLGMWMVKRPALPSQGKASAPAPDEPMNAAHEKAFLEDQLTKKPGHPPVLLRLAEIERASGKTDEARKRLEEAVKADPDLLEARLELGRVLFEAGDVEGAIIQTRAIIERDPKNVDALYNLGAIFANQGKYPDARTYWQQARAAGPDTPSGKKAADGLKQLGL